MYGKKYMGVQRATFIIDPEGKIARVFPKVQPKKHDDLVLKALASSRPERPAQALSHDDDEERRVEREPAEHRGEREAAAAVQALVGEEAAGEAEADREDGVAVELPVGEDQADPDRDRRLEDHRAGDVAERQRVLAFAHPEEAVDLLRQLGRQRRQDQGQDEGLDAEAVGDRRAAPRRRGGRRRPSPRGRPGAGGRRAQSAGSRGARRGARRSAGSASPRPAPRRRRAGCGGCRRRRRGGSTIADGIRTGAGGPQASAPASGEEDEEEEQVALQGRPVGLELAPPARVASR